MKRQATADAIGTHERASATPTRAAHEHARTGTAPASLPDRLDLRFQQEWFARIVTTPESEPAPVDDRSASTLVTPSSTLTSLERLDIYRQSYHARLVECLADDYPVLQHYLAEDAFESLCRAYIARFPSTGPNLNVYGQHMAAFCRTQPLPDAGFAADLASLEWAIVCAIHAPTAAVIAQADLAGIPADRWPGARLVANPSLRVLHLDYPANAYLQAFRTGRTSRAAVRLGNPRRGLPHGPEHLAHGARPRSGGAVRVARGGCHPRGFAANASRRCWKGSTPSDAAQQVMGWFQSGVASGLFSDVLVDRGERATRP